MISQCPCESLLNNKVLVVGKRRSGEVKNGRNVRQRTREQQGRGGKMWRENDRMLVIRKEKVTAKSCNSRKDKQRTEVKRQ